MGRPKTTAPFLLFMRYQQHIGHIQSVVLFSSFVSSSTSENASPVDFLNSFSVCPAALPISGNFFGPKMIRAMINIRIILRSEEHTSELQSRFDLVCRLLLEKKKQ